MHVACSTDCQQPLIFRRIDLPLLELIEIRGGYTSIAWSELDNEKREETHQTNGYGLVGLGELLNGTSRFGQTAEKVMLRIALFFG